MSAPAVELLKRMGAEAITYWPQDGLPRTVQAVVERRPMQAQVVTGRETFVNSLEVWIAQDGTDGVTTVHAGHDQVEFKRVNTDLQATKFRVAAVLEEPQANFSPVGNLWKLEVRA